MHMVLNFSLKRDLTAQAPVPVGCPGLFQVFFCHVEALFVEAHITALTLDLKNEVINTKHHSLLVTYGFELQTSFQHYY